MTAVPGGTTRKRPLDRLLSLFTEVREGEGLTAVLLMLEVFLLLMAYYIIKPLREALILGNEGAEVKSYAAAGMALLLIGLVPAYSAFASRVHRSRLITWVTLFFISNLALFYILARAHTPHIGVAFFLWVGIFNLMIIAQFWSFANDVYTPEQGKRLFAVVGFGSSLGAIAGGLVAKPLIHALGIQIPMLIAALVLGVSLALFRIVNARENVARDAGGKPVPQEAPIAGRGAFELVLRDRYLLLIAALVLIYNCVNTNGEYLLGKTVKASVESLAAVPGVDMKALAERRIGEFYAGFFTWVNWIGAAVQLLVVGRFLKWFGVRAALFVLPLIALGGYGLIALAPLAIGLIRNVKIAENATDYSLYTTTRQTLFLPTSRDVKYKGKAAVDTFFVRIGDVVSAGFVFLGTKMMLSPRAFAGVNLVLVMVWLLIVVGIARRYRAMTAESVPVP